MFLFFKLCSILICMAKSITDHLVVIGSHFLLAPFVILVESLLGVVRLRNLVLAHVVAHVAALFLHVIDNLGSLRPRSWPQTDQHLARRICHSPLKHLSDLVLVHWLPLVVEFQFVFRASHSENFESVDLRYEFRWALRQKFRELFQENVGKTGAEICPIDV